MSSSRYLRGDLLEAIARNALKKYDPHLVIGMGVQRVPIEEIIESMGLTIEYQYIRRDGRILGETVFDDGYIPLYDMKKRKYGLFFMSRGTIIIDASLLGDKTDSRLRFTCAHELAHWLIHQELYRGSGEAAAMANNAQPILELYFLSSIFTPLTEKGHSKAALSICLITSFAFFLKGSSCRPAWLRCCPGTCPYHKQRRK